jgi:uncharacterized protein YvpB
VQSETPTNSIAIIPRLRRRPLLIALIGLAALIITATTYAAARTQRAITLKLAEQQSVAVIGPLQVSFGQDVAAGFATTIEPSLPGTWQPTRNLLGTAGVSFRPTKRFEAGRTYQLHITNLHRAITGAPLPDITQTFKIQTPSALKSITPAADAKNILVNARFTVTLATANRGTRDLKAALTPAVPLKLITSNDTTFTWEPAIPLKQGAQYTFTLDDAAITNPDHRRLTTVPFTTVTPPTITSARTGGYFAPGQAIDIIFDQPMDTTAPATTFEFGATGKGTWSDDHTYHFVPEDLKVATAYDYKVNPGLHTKAGGVLETVQVFHFATNGAVSGSLSPGGGGVSVKSTIHVAFDQPVDHASAEARFSIKPAVAGKFSWSGNTLTFTPAGLGYQTPYTYAVASGVAPVWGLPSAQTLSGSFTTENQVIKLNVPAYSQQYPMSCELSSLRMLLAYRGISVSDYDILMRIGYHPRARDMSTNTWDDPNQTYVGYVDQAVFRVGFGVHAGPVATAAQGYGHSAIARFGVDAGFIASNIYAGNPVEVWGHIVPAKPDSWNTAGGVVQTTTSEHARVVYGVVGSVDNPVGFYVNDPYTGKGSYWSAGDLLANMNAALPASNQAVVVY